jgi:hypothetical protein
MSKVDDIKNQLAIRLEKQAKISAPIVEEKEFEKKNKRLISKKTGVYSVPSKATTAANLIEKSAGAVKLSVSLYNYDIDCLDKIKDFMRTQGVRNLSDSEALRLACRTVQTDTKIIEIYRSMLTEDRRRKK